jgi:hypothetical protein
MSDKLLNKLSDWQFVNVSGHITSFCYKFNVHLETYQPPNLLIKKFQ